MTNKIVWFCILTLLIAVTGNASSFSIDQRLIGTWKSAEGKTWIFNADGTGSVDDNSFRFTSFSNKIATYISVHAGIFPMGTVVSDYVVSTNGRTFILYTSTGAVWLEKKN